MVNAETLEQKSMDSAALKPCNLGQVTFNTLGFRILAALILWVALENILRAPRMVQACSKDYVSAHVDCRDYHDHHSKHA